MSDLYREIGKAAALGMGYGRGPMMSSLAELQWDYERKIREAMYVNPVYLIPAFKAGEFIPTPKLETKMPLVEPKLLSHPVQLLVNALNSAKSSRDSQKANVDYHEKTFATFRESMTEYEAKVVELTKALKKLGHKA